MFELINVSRKYGEEFALRDVSLKLGGGISFLTGASGSGKTTLLRILSGMDSNFTGEMHYRGTDMKTLTEREKSALWGSEFGFVWQDFNLLDDRTVMENILLPKYLRSVRDERAALKILKDLKLSELAQQKAGTLSGGQKQRVAIARELMKDPQVIFADEPTSALDAKSAKTVMDLLYSLSKKRAVIVVTHDTSLIDGRARVYELDKGELEAAPDNIEAKKTAPASLRNGHLNLSSAFTLGVTALRRRWGRAASTALSLLVSATLLLVPVSGIVSQSGSAAFEELLSTYGDSLLDISIAQSFMSAGGTDGQEPGGPKADVTQNVDGLFEKYRDDPRVSYVLFAQAFNDIVVSMDGESHEADTTNNMPVMNSLTAGSMPMGKGSEVVVPENFIKKLDLTAEQALGKEISFQATVNNWESGQPVITPVNITAEIVGIINTDMVTEYGGQTIRTPIDDSFFFSPSALKEMRERAGMKAEPGNFYIRANTPEDLISLKDELNASGIVPLGRFELVEDIVRLSQQTAQQSGSASLVIATLSVLAVLATALLNALMRRREYAIFKVSGCSPRQLTTLTLTESALLTAGAAAAFLCASPILNRITMMLWNLNLLNGRLLIAGLLLILCAGTLSWAATAAAAASFPAADTLRTGGK